MGHEEILEWHAGVPPFPTLTLERKALNQSGKGCEYFSRIYHMPNYYSLRYLCGVLFLNRYSLEHVISGMPGEDPR
jgi:hypothetical protein